MVNTQALKYSLEDVPPFTSIIFLALQQIFVVAIYLALIGFVAKAANLGSKTSLSMMSMSLLAMGFATILQTLRKGPIGAGFLITNCPAVTYFIAIMIAAKMGGIKLVLGMTVFAGFIEMLFALFANQLKFLFPLVVTGLTFTALGLSVGIMAFKNIMLGTMPSEKMHISGYVIYLITLLIIVSLSIWGKGIWKLTSLMIGLIIGCILSYVFHLFNPNDLSEIAQAPYVALPDLSYWGLSFSWNLMPLFVISAIAAGLRTIGCVMTSQQINDIDISRSSKMIKKGTFTDGFAVFLSGLIGTYPTGASPSAIGITKATGATSRVIGYGVGAFCILFSFSPKIAAFWISVPVIVVSAGLTITSCIMLVGGIRLITNKPIDLRNTYIIGISILLALSPMIFPGFYQQFPVIFQDISHSMLSMIAMSAIILNLAFYLGKKKKLQVMLNKVNCSESEILKSAEEIGVDSKLIEKAAKPLHDLLGAILKQNVNDSPIELSLSHDEIYFTIKIKYNGTLPQISASENYKSENLFEDQVYILGLSSLFKEYVPENLTIKKRKNTCILNLRFSV